MGAIKHKKVRAMDSHNDNIFSLHEGMFNIDISSDESSYHEEEFIDDEEPLYRSLSVAMPLSHPTSFEATNTQTQQQNSLAHLQAYCKPATDTKAQLPTFAARVTPVQSAVSPPALKRQKASHFDWEPSKDLESAWTYSNLSPDVIALQAQHIGARVDVKTVCQFFLENHCNADAPAYAEYYQMWRPQIHSHLVSV